MTLGRMRARFANRTMASGMARRIQRRLRGQLFIDRAGSDTSRFLAGSPRSGTTWIAEMVTAGQNMRLVFEPFHPEEVPSSRAFEHRQYLRPNSCEQPYRQVAERIVSGSTRSSWSDRFNHTTLPRGRLIKEVRANLMLGWLHARFPRMPICLVIRHPAAVLASQKGIDWDFHAETARLLAQDQLMEDHLTPFVDLLRRAESEIEQSLLVWCVENYVPLQQLRRGDLHVVCYEHLVERPEDEFRKLMSFYQLPFNDELMSLVGRPSGVTAKGSAVVAGGDLLRSWQDKISPDERRRIVELLHLFGLDRLYGEDPMPLLDDPNTLLPEIPSPV